MRGYHSTNHKEPGYEQGILPTSLYYAPPDDMNEMNRYVPLHGSFFSREFPTSWRDIDAGIGHLPGMDE
jgi:hypothetical protein